MVLSAATALPPAADAASADDAATALPPAAEAAGADDAATALPPAADAASADDAATALPPSALLSAVVAVLSLFCFLVDTSALVSTMPLLVLAPPLPLPGTAVLVR